ncbi:MFS transporter [Domibacillus sp. 8LH]|uniref:MFS transporter n=1 Tax=Domibacillus sp. 8LH TaxID=3073900 RepID=UPI00316BB755
MASETESLTAVKKPNFLVASIILAVMLNPLNTSMITVALPDIQQEFALTSKDITWLIASYFVVCAVFLPLLGKISDVYGRKKIFIAGLLLVSISSFVAPFSQNMLSLLLMRSIQAIGTSALYPAGMGIVRAYIKENQNGVIGLLSVFATTSAAFGPTISGLLIGWGSWHVIFYVNFPIIIVSALLGLFFIPADVQQTETTFKWDGAGILLFSLCISLWIYWLQTIKTEVNVWLLVICIVLTIVFYKVEKKKEKPFIDVLFLKNHPNISLIYILYSFATLIFFSMLLSMPLYMNAALTLDAKETGLMMLSLSVFAMVITPIATRWIEQSGHLKPLLAGAFIGIGGVLLLLTINKESSLLWIAVILSIIGLSNGILNIGLQTLLYSFVPVAESGTASGLFLTSRFIGNILASSLFGLMFATGINDYNQNWLAVILAGVSVVVLSGILYIGKSEKQRGRFLRFIRHTK